MGHEDGLGVCGHKVVVGHVVGRVSVAAVVVVPVLGGHEDGHSEQYDADSDCGHLFRDMYLQERLAQPVIDGHDCQAYPYGEYVEAAGIGVVPLAYLIRRLVEVQDDGYAREEEEQEGDPPVALVLAQLEEQADDAQQQRQHVVMVLGLVVYDVVRAFGLVSQSGPVNEVYAALPVAGYRVSGHLSVQVVLPSGKIPHEVAHVHPVELVVEEELEIVPECGHLLLCARNDLAAVLGVALVEPDMRRVLAVHPGEEHLAVGSVDIVYGVGGLVVFAVQFGVV